MNQGGVLACCAICSEKTHRRCTRCLSVYYCNTEHQRQDWKRHKIECAPKGSIHTKSGEDSTVIGTATRKDKEEKSIILENSVHGTSNEGNAVTTTRIKKSKSRKNHKEGSDDVVSKHSAVSSENVQQSAKTNSSGCESSVISSVLCTNRDSCSRSAITYEGSSENEILNETTQQLSAVDFYAAGGSSNVLRAVNRSDLKMPVLPEQPARPREYPEASLQGSAAPFTHSANSYHMDPSDPCYEVCQRVIRDMTQYGVCVLDNFLGEEKGLSVLNEVLQMYNTGIFRAGQLVSNPKSTEAQTIRSDLITWIDGQEPKCYSIKQLMAKVDSIILRANKMTNNGRMGDFLIDGRTKAMVACYPGSGAHYVKHVDNPNKDGRCITAIYYLNLDWDVQTCGGLLRVFPSGYDNKVADIEPIFDRMLFFWSDRRNPHEVQPAYSTRYAITLWYFDAQEKAELKKNLKKRLPSSSSKGSTA